MIYIDISSFEPNDNWLQRANQLAQDLLSAVDKKAFIEQNKSFWGEIKSELLNLCNKCWFSEELVGGSAYQVEHFRPKGSVTRTDFKKILKSVHEEQRSDWTKANKYIGEGYWWLAFEYTNFRIIEGNFNSTKLTRFPLKLGSFIAYTPTDDIDSEEHILLDPTKQGDPELLTFDGSGKVLPAEIDKTKYEYARAVVSINVYGLNKYPILINKRLLKWKACDKAIKRANNKFLELEDSTENLDKFQKLYNEFKDFIDNDIRPHILPNSEFSAVAIACVRSYNYEWIEDYVLA